MLPFGQWIAWIAAIVSVLSGLVLIAGLV
jgi:uncharacterized membrane protein YphA (DoxX/SURF4 family)